MVTVITVTQFATCSKYIRASCEVYTLWEKEVCVPVYLETGSKVLLCADQRWGYHRSATKKQGAANQARG